MQEMIDKLQNKIKTYKRQVEEAVSSATPSPHETGGREGGREGRHRQSKKCVWPCVSGFCLDCTRRHSFDWGRKLILFLFR